MLILSARTVYLPIKQSAVHDGLLRSARTFRADHTGLFSNRYRQFLLPHTIRILATKRFPGRELTPIKRLTCGQPKLNTSLGGSHWHSGQPSCQSPRFQIQRRPLRGRLSLPVSWTCIFTSSSFAQIPRRRSHTAAFNRRPSTWQQSAGRHRRQPRSKGRRTGPATVSCNM